MIHQSSPKNRITLILLSIFVLQFTACAEGPLWRAGKYSPWARNQWAEEEKIADTLFVRKREMSEAVASVVGAPVEEQQKVADSIAEVVNRDSVLLLRIHGVNLLSKLNCPSAIQTLANASNDPNADIRTAAIKSWQNMPAEKAIPQLQNMIGSDTNVDVRLAATQALGNFSGQQAINAISMALDDSDPALQLRAAESLQKITGEQLGRDIGAWQQFVSKMAPQDQSTGFKSPETMAAGLDVSSAGGNDFRSASNPTFESTYR